ncbi:MAG TPA: AgmX/PglI C-terminal domain-containing protein [Polyangia bacterium]
MSQTGTMQIPVVGMGAKAKVIIVALLLAVIGSLGFAFTRQPDDTELRKARGAATECKTESDELKDKVAKLRAALTAALNQPSTLKIDDAELLRLLGTVGAPPRAAGPRVPRDGELSQAAVVAVVRGNKGQFQTCYERALKRNSDLHGVSVNMTLAFAVRGNGTVGDIQLSPRVDEAMNACMKSAVGRWRFPAFVGDPVRVEIPVPLVPKG